MLDFSAHGIKSGIYTISIDGKIVYVGESSDLWNRAKQHRNNILNSDKVWYPLCRKFCERGHNITFKVVEAVEPRLLREKEKQYIAICHPIFNLQDNPQKFTGNFDYLEAAKYLGLTPRPFIGIKEIQQRKLAKSMGWFGSVEF